VECGGAGAAGGGPGEKKRSDCTLRRLQGEVDEYNIIIVNV